MANTDAEAQENERLNHLRIDNRRRESERFVETCAAELRRQQKYQLEVWPPRELAQRSLVTAQVAAAVADCQEVNAFEFGLLLKAEDLADLLVRLVKAGDIHTRTPLADAVESFYHMGSSYDCTDCGLRPGILQFSAADVCIHCYLHH